MKAVPISSFNLTASIIIILSTVAVNACLTDEQLSALHNISTYLNMSNSSIISIFDNLCLNITELGNDTSILKNVTSSINLTNYYNSSEVDNIINETNSTLSANMSSIFSEVNQSATSIAISIANSTRDDYTDLLLKYEDTVDERLMNFKQEFPTEDEVNSTIKNITTSFNSRMHNFEMNISEKYSTVRQFWMWLFLAAMGGIFIFAYLVRYKPESVSFVTGVKGIRRSASETTTPGEFAVKIEKVRELSKKAVDNNLSKESKQKLLDMIRSEEIKTETELEDWTATLGQVEGLKEETKRLKKEVEGFKSPGKKRERKE